MQDSIIFVAVPVDKAYCIFKLPETGFLVLAHYVKFLSP